ncbi:Small nuclear ribonucleoprotein-associated protein B-like 2, partial [Homarus americanus]
MRLVWVTIKRFKVQSTSGSTHFCIVTFSKNNKMLSHIGYRMKITMQDSRTFIGIFKAVDKHMNVILSDCEEFRCVRGKKTKEEKQEKRTMGLLLLRGETIVTMTLRPPPTEQDGPRVNLPGSSPGPGVGRPAGRGMPGTGGSGLQGPQMMQPAACGPQLNVSPRGGPPGGMPPHMMGGMPPHMGRGGPMAPPTGSIMRG